MLFDRQKRLLALLDALGGRIGNLDFQKQLFLYCQESGPSPAYEFVPYKFGAFSFTSYADRRKLVEQGFLLDDEQVWILTPEGQRAARAARTSGAYMATFVRRYGGLSGDALVAETYRRFPYYATRSEIAARILRGDAEAQRRVEAARPSLNASALSTIGYEGHTLESYLNQLLRSGISLLCDVRRNPISRKYGFSKGTLSKGCSGVGIRYEHLPDLGIESENRQHLETQADYDTLFAEYRSNWLPLQGESLEAIHKWIQNGERVALTCYERLFIQCHRHCVAKEMQFRYGTKFTPKHL
jgi:hypothetical protein